MRPAGDRSCSLASLATACLPAHGSVCVRSTCLFFLLLFCCGHRRSAAGMDDGYDQQRLDAWRVDDSWVGDEDELMSDDACGFWPGAPVRRSRNTLRTRGGYVQTVTISRSVSPSTTRHLRIPTLNDRLIRLSATRHTPQNPPFRFRSISSVPKIMQF